MSLSEKLEQCYIIGKKKGLEFATNRFLQENTKTDAKSFKNSLRGNIDFIGLVRGKDDKLYIKYKNKFELLQNCIDYSTISHIRVRKKLTEDNKKMERIIFDKVLSQNDKFISFCTTAFHQIENLLRYYYWERFARKIKCFKAFYVAENLESEIQKSNIVLTNEQIEEKRESIENQIQNRKTIKDIQVNSFVTLFEKEFYLDKQKKSYKNIAFLKDIRNDDSHRCSFFSIDEESILKKGKEIKESCIKFKKRKKREKKLPENEKEILEQVKFIHFVHQQNYKIVRRTLFNVLDKITIRLAELGRNQMDT